MCVLIVNVLYKLLVKRIISFKFLVFCGEFILIVNRNSGLNLFKFTFSNFLGRILSKRFNNCKNSILY